MKKQNNIICTVLLVALIIAIPLAVFLIRDIDNDTWFMLNHGRYIMKNGLYPQYEPFTVHEGMEFKFQKWLSCILFWLIYKYLGKVALKLFLYGVYMAFVFAMYKLLEYIKKDAKIQNLATLVVLNAAMTQYLYTRPQMFTYLFLAIELIVLEKYVRENKVHLLVIIPILSLVEIQLHSTIWPIILIYMLPYMFDVSFSDKIVKKLKILPVRKYKRLPIWLAFIASAAVAVINPYGFESVVYLVKSLQIPELKMLISEVRAPEPLSVNAFVIAVSLVIFVHGFAKKKKIELRYLFLFGGTTLMSMMSARQMSFMLIPAAMLMAYFFDFKKISNVMKASFVLILALVSFDSVFEASWGQTHYQQYVTDACDALYEYEPNPEDTSVFNLDDEGSYLEFLGFRTYADTRAEVFSDKINNSKNYLAEKIGFESETVSYKKFIYQYDYKYAFIRKVYKKQIKAMDSDKNLKRIYENRLFVIYEIENHGIKGQ